MRRTGFLAGERIVDKNCLISRKLTSKLKKITTFKSGYAECQIKTKDGFVNGVIDLWGGIKAYSGEGGLIKV